MALTISSLSSHRFSPDFTISTASEPGIRQTIRCFSVFLRLVGRLASLVESLVENYCPNRGANVFKSVSSLIERVFYLKKGVSCRVLVAFVTPKSGGTDFHPLSVPPLTSPVQVRGLSPGHPCQP